jgi:hypothetical protein
VRKSEKKNYNEAVKLESLEEDRKERREKKACLSRYAWIREET